MRQRYPLNQSPLYRLRRRQALADLFKLSIEDLEFLANVDPPPYKCFELPSHNPEKKGRWIEWPRRPLQRFQRRLAQLLDRILPPDYIHSGFRQRSYLTNAAQHDYTVRLIKIDIRRFFPSSSAKYVLRCFKDAFQCSPDVTMILTKLTTIGGHLPTGASTSTILSFYMYKPMFDEIYELALDRGLVMSCCVDDMTFSGHAATRGVLNEIRKIALKYGLKTHKYHCFEPSQTKIVTGVALTPKGIRLPNERRKKLSQTLSDFKTESDVHKKIKLGEQLLGRVTEAAQIEEQFVALITPAAESLQKAKRALPQ